MNDFISYAKKTQTKICLETKKLSGLLDLLNNPEKKQNFIHITGTNGKGSVCAFLESILICGGKTPGLFTSPELISKTECIRCGGKSIPENELDSLLKEIGELAETLPEMPSGFEILFAAALVYFERKNCSPVIIEVGMGGEGDATNVIENTAMEIITRISVDHTKYLGKTEKEIAEKKSAIIKKNSAVFSSIQKAPAKKVILKKCHDENCSLKFIPPFESAGYEEIYEKISYGGDCVTLGIGGANQLENAALAAAAAEHLKIEKEAVLKGLLKTSHPGRFEKIKDGLYFDGAHNPDGAKALAFNIKRYFPDTTINLIMGVMADKDYEKMLKYLKGDKTSFYFVDVKDNPRSEKKEVLLSTAKKLGISAKACKSVKDALAIAGNQHPVILCGSLYLYREFISSL